MAASQKGCKLDLSVDHAKRYAQSIAYGKKIETVIPGGVDSPFRAFHEVGGDTIFFDRAKGSRLYDLDGNSYIDYLGAWGPAILGHCPDDVVRKCQETLAKGPVFGAPHVYEMEMAELVIAAVPSIEKIRFVNSGTEAVMSAIRLARGFTGQETIIMFEGCYHGHCDATLASNGHQSSSGIPDGAKAATVLAKFNDLESVETLLNQHKGKVAGIIVEPVAGSMGVITPVPGFLEGLRALADRFGVLLIIDEVLTGFRVAFGGAQNYYNVKADITCFGKALGGGMPIGAYGGSKEIMNRLQPDGDVYQAGTFSGNPVTMAGGIATLTLLKDPSVYQTLEDRTAQLFAGLGKVIAKNNWPIQLPRLGSMFSIVFAEKPVLNFQDSLTIDCKAFAKFFHFVLDNGIYLPPSAVDAACLSSVHTVEEIEETIEIMSEGFRVAFSKQP
jgi:glutamate-1-semialdehyde 2,1-aminomutase